MSNTSSNIRLLVPKRLHNEQRSEETDKHHYNAQDISTLSSLFTKIDLRQKLKTAFFLLDFSPQYKITLTMFARFQPKPIQWKFVYIYRLTLHVSNASWHQEGQGLIRKMPIPFCVTPFLSSFSRFLTYSCSALFAKGIRCHAK